MARNAVGVEDMRRLRYGLPKEKHITCLAFIAGGKVHDDALYEADGIGQADRRLGHH